MSSNNGKDFLKLIEVRTCHDTKIYEMSKQTENANLSNSCLRFTILWTIREVYIFNTSFIYNGITRNTQMRV